MNKAKAERKFGKMEKVYLTKLAPNCGCAAKVGPGTLAGVLCGLPKFQDPIFWLGLKLQMMRLYIRFQMSLP